MRKLMIVAAGVAAVALVTGFAVAQGFHQQQQQQPTAPHQRGSYLLQADANHDGLITRAEFDASRSALFDRLDANHDGLLSPGEGRQTASSRAGAGYGRGRFLRLDADNNGKISRAEFLAGPTARFDRMDANHDGQLEADEMTMQRAGAQSQAGFGRRGGGRLSADANHDGEISRAEFIAAGDAMFDRLDANHDGRLTQEEAAPHRRSQSQ